jgi:peptidoglycan/xylan/chitin deacetylase (PgdA/CDA1 family)
MIRTSPALKRGVASGLLHSGALSLHRRWLERGRAILLLYHRVNDAGDPMFPALPLPAFRMQLDYLARSYRIEPLDDVLEWLERGAPGPPRVALTIDDGYADTYECVLPELERRGIPATLFLSTSPPETGAALWIDHVRWMLRNARASRLQLPGLALPDAALTTLPERVRAAENLLWRLKGLSPAVIRATLKTLEERLDPEGEPLRSLTWEQIRRLVAGPVRLGAHCHWHYILSRLEGAEVTREIALSVQLIHERTGARVSSFAYPNGLPDDYDDRAIATLRHLGLRWALTADAGFARPDADAFRLPRLHTNYRFLPLFAARLAGLTEVARGRGYLA